MTTSNRPPDETAAEPTDPWMDGLAGRAGAGTAHREGARIRTALAPEAGDQVVARWRDIEARARAAAPTTQQEKPSPTPRPGKLAGALAALDPRPRFALGWAAAALVAVGVAMLWPAQEPEPNVALRGVPGEPAHQGAEWHVEQPQAAAEALAADLRALHAEVALANNGPDVVLSIRAQPEAVSAVNARLAELETGLDATGRLQLIVRPLH